jgi:hypothetical protein
VARPPGADDDAAVEDLDALVRAIESGRDRVPVPEALTGVDPEDPEQEPYRSFVVKVRTMGVAERIKLALRGNKEVRIILMRDTNRVVSRLVLENPKITEDEIVSVTHNRSADEEVLRVIGERREWIKNYQIRLGLVTNPKTPVGMALRFLGTLEERDIRRLARSKNVPDAVAAQARRTLAARQVRDQR